MFGHSQLSFIEFFLTLASGITYILATIPIVTDANYLKTGRIIKLSPLFVAVAVLLSLKFVSSFNPAAICLFLAEIIPGLGKRLILLYALASGPSTPLGQALCPFDEEVVVKAKKD